MASWVAGGWTVAATEAGALAEPQKLPLLQPEEKRKRWEKRKRDLKREMFWWEKGEWRREAIGDRRGLYGESLRGMIGIEEERLLWGKSEGE